MKTKVEILREAKINGVIMSLLSNCVIVRIYENGELDFEDVFGGVVEEEERLEEAMKCVTECYWHPES